MVKRFRRLSFKAGLPPGTVVHIGEEASGETTYQLFDYNESEYRETHPSSLDEAMGQVNLSRSNWINIDGVHNPEAVTRAGEIFHIHPLALEDIANTEQRPKAEEYENQLFIVIKMLSFDEKSGHIDAEQVSMILMPHLLITFQEKPGDVFDPIRERIRNNKGRIRKMGTDYLAYCLLDIVVDNYYFILERLGEQIEDIEDAITENPNHGSLETIQDLKKELIYLRKSVWPLRELVSSLEKRESTLIKKATLLYLRDVYDHTIELIDTLESLRDVASSLVDIYLSSISNRQNVVMKTLTLIATIFMPLTFIVGVYGMNFHYMPELAWPWAYPAVIGLMITITAGMLIYFKKNGWFK